MWKSEDAPEVLTEINCRSPSVFPWSQAGSWLPVPPKLLRPSGDRKENERLWIKTRLGRDRPGITVAAKQALLEENNLLPIKSDK